MICFCGKELDSSAEFAWQQCTYKDNRIVYAVCMHGVVCINENNEILNKIDILESLKYDKEQDLMKHGYPHDRLQNEIEALEYVIKLLKEKII